MSGDFFKTSNATELVHVHLKIDSPFITTKLTVLVNVSIYFLPPDNDLFKSDFSGRFNKSLPSVRVL